jgi:Cys-tRNA(Pro) deacylase
LSDNVTRVKESLESRGIKVEVLKFEESTRTSELAARAIGCDVAQIAKSLLFVIDDRDPVLVIASGRNKVDTTKLAQRVGNLSVKIADAKRVKQITGFPIGGVPPVAHRNALRTILDPSLLRFNLIYAAAGMPNAVFGIDPRVLQKLTGAELAEVFQG